MIVEAAPSVAGARSADRNIAINAEEDDGIYRPSRHLVCIKNSFEREQDPKLRPVPCAPSGGVGRAGHVERVDEDQWRVPDDIVERGRAYDRTQGGDRLQLRTLSTIDLERQIASDGATWLDRELIARDPMQSGTWGFGRQVKQALNRRAQRLVEMGCAVTKDGKMTISRASIATLERKEVLRVGREMASCLGRIFQPVKAGEYVACALIGSTNLASGRFAMLESLSADGGLGFALVPWQPVLDKRIGERLRRIIYRSLLAL